MTVESRAVSLGAAMPGMEMPNAYRPAPKSAEG
jgi:hypothetical protein